METSTDAEVKVDDRVTRVGRDPRVVGVVVRTYRTRDRGKLMAEVEWAPGSAPSAWPVRKMRVVEY